MERHWETYGRNENRKLKPDDWAIPYEELPSELKILPKENYERMLAERPQWKGMFFQGREGVFVAADRLLNRLRDDRTPMTLDEHIIADKLSRNMGEMHEKHRHFFNTLESSERPGTQEFTHLGNHFPENRSFYREEHDWEIFRKEREWSKNNFKFNEQFVPHLQTAFANRFDLERQWQNEDQEKTLASLRAELANRDNEHDRRSREYQEQLRTVTNNLQKQTTELSGVRAELSEGAKRQQEAEVLQRNLKRRLTVYHADMKRRIPSGESGRLAYPTESEKKTPDLFLEALLPSSSSRRKF